MSFLNKFHINKSSGFLMVEVLIVAAVISASFLIAFTVAQKSIFLSRQSVQSAQASFLLEEGAEIIRITRDNDWDNVEVLTLDTDYYPTFTAGSWVLDTEPTNIGIFTRTISLSSVNREDSSGDISSSGTLDPLTKQVTINVSWQNGSKAVTKSISFFISDIFNTND